MGTLNKFSTLVAAPIVALGLSVAAPAKAVPVDAEILLLMDVSRSVNSTEFNLQRTGYANAFQSAAVHSAIASTTNGVAVRLVQWSGATQQAESIAWTHIFDVASSNAVGAAIAAMSRSFSGSTAIGAAINNTFASIGDEVDVSGDGTTNDGIASVTGRNNALAAGVDVINGLVIGGSSGVLSHYQSDVIGGTNENGSPAFALTASTFSDFETAITNKLSAKITGTGIPEPGMIAIFGLGLAGLAYTRRRKAA